MEMEELYEVFIRSTGISTDTRSLEKGNLFFALKGENFDGNKYSKMAMDLGATAVIVDNPEYSNIEGAILVQNVLLALQNLATHHRDQVTIPIIGITGSNGKTTTKELLSAVLSTVYNTYHTEGNLNNHIGVPLSILNITKDHEIAVIEMGANHVGEIRDLCNISKPSHGLITNIGKAHLEGFGGIEGVKKGKSELYYSLRDSKGVIFLNENDETLKSLVPESVAAISCIKSFTNNVKNTWPFLEMEVSGKLLSTQLIGKYNATNIMMAIGIGNHFKVPLEQSINAISEYSPTNNRSQSKKIGSNKYILDAYNANPTSMRLAIENFTSIEHANKVLILGDMKELGEYSVKEHQSLLEYVSLFEWSAVYTVGEDLYNLDNKNKKFENSEDLRSYLVENPFKDSLVLMKASRSIHLESILD